MKGRFCAIALLSVVPLAGGCRPEDGPPVASEVLREGVDMVMIPMDWYLTREGIRRALLHTDTAEFVTEGEIQMRGVELTFYDVDGREASVITAESGIFYENTEDMEASGSIVVLDRREDRRLETETLRYVAAEDRMYGDRPFTLWEDGGRTELRGAAFESDPGLDSVRVRSPSGQSERPPTPTVPRAGPDTPGSVTGPDSSQDTAAVRDTTPSQDTATTQDTAASRDTATSAGGGAPSDPIDGARGVPTDSSAVRDPHPSGRGGAGDRAP